MSLSWQTRLVVRPSSIQKCHYTEHCSHTRSVPTPNHRWLHDVTTRDCTCQAGSQVFADSCWDTRSWIASHRLWKIVGKSTKPVAAIPRKWKQWECHNIDILGHEISLKSAWHNCQQHPHKQWMESDRIYKRGHGQSGVTMRRGWLHSDFKIGDTSISFCKPRKGKCEQSL